MIDNIRFRIAVGITPGIVETRVKTWAQIVKALSKHKQANTKNGNYIVGGAFDGTGIRTEEHLIERTMLTYDIDDSGVNFEILKFELLWNIKYAFVVYTTYSHEPDKPRVRVIIPLSRPVAPAQYRALAIEYAKVLDVPVDDCSYKPNQYMYAPRCPDLSKAWAYNQAGECLDVDLYLCEDSTAPILCESDNSDYQALELAIRSEPLDLADEQVEEYLLKYPAEGLNYFEWLNVGMSLHHQYRGTDQGFQLWYKWSLINNPDEDREKLRKKYQSISGRLNSLGTAVRNFSSLIYDFNSRAEQISSNCIIHAGGSDFDDLLLEASEIESLGTYAIFKDKLLGMDANILGSDLRAMLAAELAGGLGKLKGLTKSDIKRVITPAASARGIGGLSSKDQPSWLEDWVFIEKTCKFANTALNYAIKREAFNAKYDRETEPRISCLPAATLALVKYKTTTVVDEMYWPGAVKILCYEGKDMLNTYYQGGIKPCSVMDLEGQEIVNKFLAHIRLLLPDKKEQLLLLHWLVFVYQNPGKHVNWAILIQSSPGAGKTYFGDVMKLMLGDNVRSLASNAIESRFTGWASGCILNVVEEVRVNGVNRYAALDLIKPMISNPTIQIEEKGRDHRTVPNFTSYLLLTNHKDSLPINDNERRYCILFSGIQSQDDVYRTFGGTEESSTSYFEDLFESSQRRADALALFFTDYQLPDSFKPFGRAPETQSRSEMIELAISPDRQVLEDLLDRYASKYITEDFVDITELNSSCLLNYDDIPKTRSLSAIMLEKGFRQIKGRCVRYPGDPRKHYVWVKNGVADEWAIEQLTTKDPVRARERSF